MLIQYINTYYHVFKLELSTKKMGVTFFQLLVSLSLRACFGEVVKNLVER